MTAFEPTVPALDRRPLSRRTFLKGATATGLLAPRAGLIEPSHVRAAVMRQEGNGATFIMGLGGSPSDLDPHSQYDFRSGVVVRAMYEGLVGLIGAATDAFEGFVAESWKANDDQSVWTFKIRPGLTFQDGSPCDSAAVKASYERLLALDRGAVAVFSRFISDPTQMTTPDAATVVFDCGVPQPLFLTAMSATSGTQIVNTKVALEHEADGDFGNTWLQLNAEGTGTGAWTLVSFEPGQEVILERNPTYWRGWDGDHFERIIFRVVEEPATMRQLLEAGEIDAMDTFLVDYGWIDALSQMPTLTVHLSDSTEVPYYAMTETGPLASPAARQAMCYAFPYEEVIDGVYRGYASRANSLIAPAVRGYQKNGFFFETDLDKARDLLAAAGVPEGTELLMANTSSGDPIPQLYQASLAKIGITLTVEVVDLSTYTSIFYGDTPAEERPNFFAWSWWPEYNDAWNVLYPTTACDSWGSKGSNAGFYCNEEVDALLAEAKDASTLETYAELLDQVQTIITKDDVPVIAIAQPMWPTVLQSNIAGFVFNPIHLGRYDFWTLSRRA